MGEPEEVSKKWYLRGGSDLNWKSVDGKTLLNVFSVTKWVSVLYLCRLTVNVEQISLTDLKPKKKGRRTEDGYSDDNLKTHSLTYNQVKSMNSS